MKLNELKIRKLTAAGKHVPGKHSDGGGLYIEITEAGSSYWRLKYRFAGKEKRYFGQQLLAPEVSLCRKGEALGLRRIPNRRPEGCA